MRTTVDIRIAKEKTVVVHSEDDCEHVLEWNKTLRSMPQKSDMMRHVASIPNIILVKWLNEAWQRGQVGLRPFTKEFDEVIKRKLADPDWKNLRTDK